MCYHGFLEIELTKEKSISEFFETKHGADWTLIGKVDSAKESLPEDQRKDVESFVGMYCAGIKLSHSDYQCDSRYGTAIGVWAKRILARFVESKDIEEAIKSQLPMPTIEDHE